MKFFQKTKTLYFILVLIYISVIGLLVATLIFRDKSNVLLYTFFAMTGFALGYSVFAIYLIRIRHTIQMAIKKIISSIDSIRSSGGVLYEPTDDALLNTVLEALSNLSHNLRKQEQNRSEILNMVTSIASNMEIETLLDSLMPKLLESSKSNWGAFYLANNATSKLEIKSSIGFSKNIYSDFDISIGEGFIGAAALTKEATVITDIPDDTVYITRTFLGRIKPKNVMIVPIIHQECLMGILSLASIYEYTSDEIELVDIIKFYIGAAVGNSVIYERSNRLANELQFQNKLIQELNNELENKMNERNLFMNNVINNISDYAIYTLDREGFIQFWNTGSKLLHGYKSEDVINRHVNILYDVESIESGIVKQRLDTVKKEGRLKEDGWRKDKDGTSYYAETTFFTMYGNDGQIIGMADVTKNITKLKCAQENLLHEKAFSNMLFEKYTQCGFYLDREYVILNANQFARDKYQIREFNKTKFTEIFDGFDYTVEDYFKSSLVEYGVITCRKSQSKHNIIITKSYESTGNEYVVVIFTD